MIVITHYEGNQWNMYTRMGRIWKVHFLPVACEQAPLWQPGGQRLQFYLRESREVTRKQHTKGDTSAPRGLLCSP